ncbi:MAG: LamG domain-containing protein [Candidatus Acidiferrales bacterium]
MNAHATASAGNPLRLAGYSHRLSVQPGERIRFMVSSDQPSYRLDLVRLIHGDSNPKGPGFKEEVVDTPVNGVYPGHKQELKLGSYVSVGNHRLLQHTGSFTLQAWIFPTTPLKGPQGILTKWSSTDNSGYGLFLEENGALGLRIGNEKFQTGKSLSASTWYFVAATYDAPSGEITLYQEPILAWPNGDTGVVAKSSFIKNSAAPNEFPFLIAAHCVSKEFKQNDAGGHFNGKIDAPRLFSRALSANEINALQHGSAPDEIVDSLVAAWDFSKDVSSKDAVDIAPNALHGKLVNMPARAMTGHNWKNIETNFANAPGEYGAIHFHDDDLEDAAWEVAFEFDVPLDFRSAIYAARLRSDDAETYIPFFVRPRKGTTTARIAFLAPTFTYLAYANYRSGIPSLLSVYDHHSDDSGVCYASYLRPLLDLNPKYCSQHTIDGRLYPRHLCADLYLVDWMEAKGYQYDVITDEDLHLEGSELLAPYKVVITGSHPEYCSTQMLDGVTNYLQNGGRLMYLGGNGFYWVTSFRADSPRLIEVRKWAGTESWEAKPGEYYLSTTGELGGLWLRRGRAPQKLVGVGLIAMGWTNQRCGPGQYYVRQPDSFNPRAAFIFEGVGPTEAIGDFESLGLRSGTAGDEIDRFDHALGTPNHALRLATATFSDAKFHDTFLHVREDLYASPPSTTAHSNVTADLVYFECPRGGGVFSVGSIAWFGSLSYNGYDNNVSKMTDNVLRRFASNEPLST